MGLQVNWSPGATEDLEAIAELVTRDSEYYARTVVTDILSVSRSTDEYPLIGRIVPEIGDEHIRERFIYSYRLVYRTESGRILMEAAIHGKRLLENIAERFEGST